MELLLKIDKEAELPKFYKDTLMDLVKKNDQEISKNKDSKVIIFPTCFVNYNNPNLGMIAKDILDELDVVSKFHYDGCCGMPQLEGGDIDSVTKKADSWLQVLNLKNILTKDTKYCLLYPHVV